MGYKNGTEQIIQIDNQQLQEDITSNSNKIGNLSATGYTDLSAGIIDHGSQLADIVINVNFPPIPLVGVKNDGSDETDKIQNVIDFAHNNGIGKVYFPDPSYDVYKPLKVYGGISYTDPKNVQLIGSLINRTIINKVNHNTLNDGSSIGNIDSIIIFTADSGDTVYRPSLKNLYLNGTTSDGTKTAYGITSTLMLAYVDIEDVTVRADICFQSQNDMWQSSFKRFLMYAGQKGFSMLTSGTSNHIDVAFVYGSTVTAYELRGVYSTATSLAADNCTGKIYDFSYAGWVINGLGCESTGADVQVKTYQSNIVINNVYLIPPTTANAKVFTFSNDSNVIVNGGKIASDTPTELNAYLFDKGDTHISVKFINVDILDTYLLKTANSGNTTRIEFIDKYNSGIIIRNGVEMPYIGIDREINPYIDNYNKTPTLLGKAIFLDCENHPVTNKNGDDLSYSDKPSKGDVFLENNPLDVGAMGWIVTNDPATYLRDATFAKIPIVMSGTTAQRPTVQLRVGQSYFDTTLNKPIWCKNITTPTWVDATGATV